jgi:iron-sulfur cluster assembly protein
VLTITTDAAEAIRAARSVLDLPDSAGLRISTSDHSPNGSGPSFTAQLAPGPAADDEVLEDEGAQVFVDRSASSALDDKELDAEVDPGGEVTFALRDRD